MTPESIEEDRRARLAIEELGDRRRTVVLDGLEIGQVAQEGHVERDRSPRRAERAEHAQGDQDPDPPSPDETH